MKLKSDKSQGKAKGKFKKKKAVGKTSESPGKKKKDIADMTVDDMFSMIEDDDDDFDAGETSEQPVKKVKQNDKKKTKKKQKGSKDGKSKKPMDVDELLEMEDDDDDDNLEGDEEMVSASSMSRQEYLKKLKKSDPAFYATLMQSKDLLDLKGSDEEDDENDNEEENERKSSSQNGIDSQDAEELEDDGDESDFDFDEMGDEEGGIVTAAMIAEWEEELKGPKPLDALMDVQQALLAAIESLSVGKKADKEEEVTSKYKVQGSQSFNAVIRLCLRSVAPALYTLFQLKDPKQQVSKSKKWNKFKNIIKLYLRQLIALTEVMTEPTVAQSVLSRGVLPVITFYAGHPGLSKLLSRRLVSLWATSNQKVRVYAFLAIYRLTQSLQGGFVDWILKKMYMAYVQNCRFTSPNTWGVIDFMRLSLVEMYTLDSACAYQHAFVYIRQMALHLRNAIQVPKNERIQLVYNWQYVHCLHLWCDLLGKTHPNPALQPMLFPVTQVAIGTIKLQPVASFFPLVFHICRMLIDLSRNTNTFIPVLPFVLEVLNKAILKKKPKKASIRPFDWMCMLRLSKGQLSESGFKDGVVDQVYDIMISYLSIESNSIGFPDLVVPIVWQLKAFIKKCKFQNYNKKFKQLIDKVMENSNFIEERRKSVTFGISDTKAIRDWEISVRQAGTPLSKYYESWQKVREKEQQQRTATAVSVDDFDLASVKKRELENKGKEGDIYASDEEDDLGVEPRGTMKADDMEEDDDDDEDDLGEDDDYDSEGDEEDDVSGKQPPKKKAKKEKNYETTEEDFEFSVPTDVPADVVKSFEFSDDEDDDGPDRDDYGADSDSDS